MDYSRLRSLTGTELIGALERDGFILDRQTGSHCQYVHGDRRVTVSFHGSNQTFSPKILKIMIELQAKWNEADLIRLGLLK